MKKIEFTFLQEPKQLNDYKLNKLLRADYVLTDKYYLNLKVEEKVEKNYIITKKVLKNTLQKIINKVEKELILDYITRAFHYNLQPDYMNLIEEEIRKNNNNVHVIDSKLSHLSIDRYNGEKYIQTNFYDELEDKALSLLKFELNDLLSPIDLPKAFVEWLIVLSNRIFSKSKIYKPNNEKEYIKLVKNNLNDVSSIHLEQFSDELSGEMIMELKKRDFFQHYENLGLLLNYQNAKEPNNKFYDHQSSLEKHIQIASNLVIFNGFKSLMKSYKCEWILDHDGFQYKNKIEMDQGEIVFYLDGEFLNKVEFKTTVYLYLILAFYVTQARKPWENVFQLTAQQIINNSRLKQNNKSKNENMDIIKFNMEIFNNMEYELEYNDSNTDIKIQKEKLWDIKIDKLGEGINLRDLRFTFRAGSWAEYFLNKDKNYEIGYLTRDTLYTNPNQKKMLARLKMYLTFLCSHNEGKTGFVDVKDIFKNILTRSEYADLKNNAKRRADFINQWENSLIDLKEEEWKINFHKTYKEEIKPSAFKNTENFYDASRKKPKNYLKKLFNAEIDFVQPEPIPTKLKHLKNSPLEEDRKKFSYKNNPDIFKKIKETRKKKKLDQRTFAKMINKSQSYVSQLENGKKISIDEMEKVIDILEIDIN